jgi:hypothetical protein
MLGGSEAETMRLPCSLLLLVSATGDSFDTAPPSQWLLTVGA